MTKVVIDMTMSLDGFVAGPGDGKEYPLGKNDGMRIFDWYFRATNNTATSCSDPSRAPTSNR
jgi:hypothetical protein